MFKPIPSVKLLLWLIPTLLGLSAIAYLGVFVVNYRYALQQAEQPTAPVVIKTIAPKPTPPAPAVTIPASVLLDVAFTAQAPLANWDALHEEACEEASLIMVQHYFSHQTLGSPDQVDQEIKKLIGWESDNGYSVDLTASELVTVAKSYYGLKTGRVITNPTVADIKQELAKGNLVVVPAAGRVLPNPNFTPPGPIYHMLVIKGYNETQFITNDPGTRKGNGFVYLYQDLLNANHSWNPTDILQGEKAVIAFSAN